MRPRDILAANVEALMKHRADLSRNQDITAASHGKLTNGTIGRIRNADVGASLDRLEDLAAVFGLEVWQLLVEGLNPRELPSLSTTPLLEQIKSLVTAAPIGQKDDAGSEEELTNVSSSRSGASKTSGLGGRTGSALDRAVVVRTKPDGKSHPAKAVQKQGARRNTR